MQTPTLSNGLPARIFYRHQRCGGFLTVSISYGQLKPGTGGPLLTYQGEQAVHAWCPKCERGIYCTGIALEALVEGNVTEMRDRELEWIIS